MSRASQEQEHLTFHCRHALNKQKAKCQLDGVEDKAKSTALMLIYHMKKG